MNIRSRSWIERRTSTALAVATNRRTSFLVCFFSSVSGPEGGRPASFHPFQACLLVLNRCLSCSSLTVGLIFLLLLCGRHVFDVHAHCL